MFFLGEQKVNILTFQQCSLTFLLEVLKVIFRLLGGKKKKKLLLDFFFSLKKCLDNFFYDFYLNICCYAMKKKLRIVERLLHMKTHEHWKK